MVLPLNLSDIPALIASQPLATPTPAALSVATPPSAPLLPSQGRAQVSLPFADSPRPPPYRLWC
ncbi:MAG: hypothetical protein LVS60_15740 [Nodosilinea sp. LVE1205-7]|jgi:hypothetical protein